jgi:hypothetical protein
MYACMYVCAPKACICMHACTYVPLRPVCMHACTYVPLRPEQLGGFYSYSVINIVFIMHRFPVNVKILAPKVWAS